MPPPLVARMSLLARLLNVFAVPGQVFTELRFLPATVSNWLVPAFLGAAVGLLSVWIMLSQPAIQRQFQEKQMQMIEERVKAGKMTPEERQIAERFTSPVVLKCFGGAGAVLGSFLSVLWWGLVLWLLAGRMLRVPVAFGKALEVAGLAMMINVLGGIVAILLLVNLGRPGATLSLALMVKDFDATRKSHLFAAAADAFSFWVVGVRAVGLAKLTDVPFLRAAWFVLTFWLLEQCFIVLSGLGQLAM